MTPTRWKLYTDNNETWQAMLAVCEAATKSIDLEQFIFVDDAIGKQFIDVCTRKAAAGVRVRFLWDAAGSFSFFGSNIANDLKEKGIELLFFKTLVPGFFHVHNYRSWFFRDHRRTLIVDGQIGFTGGIGVWEKMRNWKDTHVEVEGPLVADMVDAFERMWNRALGKHMPKSEKRARRRAGKEKRMRIRRTAGRAGNGAGDKSVQSGSGKDSSEFIYETNNPLPKKRFVYYRLIEAIRVAKTSIYITTPYFVPTRQLARLIRLAAHRGVDVRIIIPESSDHPLVDLAARAFFQNMFDAGVKIYLYKGEMIHSKTVVIDHEWSMVGSVNMDTISLLYNFEANITSTNKRFTEMLESNFMDDMGQSEVVDRVAWKRRLSLMKIPEFLTIFIRKIL